MHVLLIRKVRSLVKHWSNIMLQFCAMWWKILSRGVRDIFCCEVGVYCHAFYSSDLCKVSGGACSAVWCVSQKKRGQLHYFEGRYSGKEHAVLKLCAYILGLVLEGLVRFPFLGCIFCTVGSLISIHTVVAIIPIWSSLETNDHKIMFLFSSKILAPAKWLKQFQWKCIRHCTTISENFGPKKLEGARNEESGSLITNQAWLLWSKSWTTSFVFWFFPIKGTNELAFLIASNEW